MIVGSFDQDKVERAINDYVKDAEDINIISLNVIPEQYGSEVFDRYTNVPKFRYHISIVYTEKK